MQQDENFDAVDVYIEAQMSEWDLPGVALAIVRNGEIVYMRGYGKAGMGMRRYCHRRALP